MAKCSHVDFERYKNPDEVPEKPPFGEDCKACIEACPADDLKQDCELQCFVD